LRALREKHRLAMLFISHDLGVVAKVADQVAVMYAGEIVEMGAVDSIFRTPAHDYTRGLIGAIPALNTDRSRPPATVSREARPSQMNRPDANPRSLPLVQVTPGHWARISR